MRLFLLQIISPAPLSFLIEPDGLTRYQPNLLGQSFQALGMAHHQQAEFNQALQAYWYALQIFKATANLVQVGRVLVQLGATYHQLGRVAAARQVTHWAIKILETLPESTSQAAALHRTGVAWLQLGDSHRAMKCLGRALLMQADLGDELGEAETLLSIGETYIQVGQVANGLNYYQRALQIYRTLKPRSGLSRVVLDQEAITLQHIARIYRSLELYTWEIECHQQSLSSLGAIGTDAQIGDILERLGDAQVHLWDWVPALAAYQRALPLFRLRGNHAAEHQVLSKIQAVYERWQAAAESR